MTFSSCHDTLLLTFAFPFLIGYNPSFVTALPIGADGVTYIPDVKESYGNLFLICHLRKLSIIVSLK